MSSWLDSVMDTSVDELYKDWDYNAWCKTVGWMEGPIAFANKWVTERFELGTEIADVACGNGQIGIGFNNSNFVIDGYDINPKMLDTFEATNYRDLFIHDMNEAPLPNLYKCITVIGAFNKSHLQSGSAKMLADSLTDDGMLIASVGPLHTSGEDPLHAYGWRDQEYLEIVSETLINSMIIEDKQQQHYMVAFRKK